MALNIITWTEDLNVSKSLKFSKQNTSLQSQNKNARIYKSTLKNEGFSITKPNQQTFPQLNFTKMNFNKVQIQINLDPSSIRLADNIHNDRKFTQWNTLYQQKRNLIFKEVQLYRNPNLIMNQNAFFIYDQNDDKSNVKSNKKRNKNDNQTDSQTDNQNQDQLKTQKKRKITKVDKYHIKGLGTNSPKTTLPAKLQQKRKKQLEAQQKTYRNAQKPTNETGKKQPKQLKTCRQSVPKIPQKSKPTPGIRNNNHLNPNSLSNKQRKQTQHKQQLEDYSSIDEQQSSFSQQIQYSKSKSKSAKGHSSSKKYLSESKKKDMKVPQKLNYLLQRQANIAQLKEKFNQQVLNEVPGRKKEAEDIFRLILSAENGSSTPICLNGNTGCGKTSLITKMLSFIMRVCNENFSTAYLNCMSMWSVHHVYSGILYKLFGLKEKKSCRALNSLFNCSKQLARTTKKVDESKELSTQIQKTKIIVLDEIDHFIKDQTFFYNLLQWTGIKHSKIVLIMISNVLDLSSKLSAKNQSRLKFEHIVFKPYTAEAVGQIVRYKYPEAEKIFQKKAIEFLCKKIVSINSDIRLLQKTYEDIIIQWSEANGLINRDNYDEQKEQAIDNIELQGDSEDSQDSKSSVRQSQHKILPQNSHQRKQLIKKLIELAKTNKIKTQNVQGSLFLTGQMCNDQLPEILKEYKIILQALHRAKKKEDISFQIMNKMYLTEKRMPSSQQLFLQMCQLKDMGLVEFRQNARNCDVIFQGFGIKVNQELHMLCPEE